METSLASTCLATFNFPVKDWQERAVRSILEGKDTVVVAGTGFGKTLTFFLPIIMRPEKLALIISPLKALQLEQQRKLESLSVTAAVLNEDTFSSTLVKDIESGRFRAIFMSPEMLLSPHRRLQCLWNAPMVRARLFLLVVDEAHCVTEWGSSFRKDYSRLGSFRTFIPPTVPMLALSATLPPKSLEELSKSLRLKDPGLVHVGNERSNVSLCVSSLRYSAKSLQDLDFLANAVSKTIVYFNTRKGAERAAVRLRKLIPNGTVLVYHACKSKQKKKDVLAKFVALQQGILCSTEAAGMGTDIPDVELVIQFLLPTTLDMLVQRIGRCARSSNLKGKRLVACTKTQESYGNQRRGTGIGSIQQS